MKKILFIDDDHQYQTIINELLVREGYSVTLAESAYEGLDLFKNNNFDLVISDLVMDKVDGLQLISLLNRVDHNVPKIILTGEHNEKKEVLGLDLDLDDYIYKPVSMEVLLKRIEKTIGNKKIRKAKLTSEVDEIEIALNKRKVYKSGELVQVTKKEYELLALLLSNKNTVYTREEILDEIWHIDKDLVDPRTVDTHVKNLRFKLDLTCINSIRGVGYEWFE